MSDLPHFSPGDPRPRSAGVLNAMLDAARAAKKTDLRSAMPSDLRFGPQDVIRIHNDTGGDILRRFAIVGLKEPIFDPDASASAEHCFIDTTCFKIEYPCTDEFRGRFAICQQPLTDGQTGVAILSGRFISLVDDAVEAGDSVDVDETARADDDALSAVGGGVARCLWSGGGIDLPSGTKWGLMRFGGGGGSLVSFTLTSADCALGTAEATVRRVPCGSSDLQVGDTISLVDDDGCYLVGDNDLLVGRNGKAVKMEGDYACEWCIVSLCCGSLASC